MSISLDTVEQQARDAIVGIAKKNKWYFVVHNGHFARRFCALQNNSGKDPQIYGALYESYYDFIGKDDKEVFHFTIPDQFFWKDLLAMVKAYVPIERTI